MSQNRKSSPTTTVINTRHSRDRNSMKYFCIMKRHFTRSFRFKGNKNSQPFQRSLRKEKQAPITIELRSKIASDNSHHNYVTTMMAVARNYSIRITLIRIEIGIWSNHNEI